MSFFTLRHPKSTANPEIVPSSTFVKSTFAITATGTADERKIASISSEVDRKTASSVPTVMTPPAYRLDAAAEKPHCGRIPVNAPGSGPHLPERASRPADRSSVFRSRYSITR